MDTNIFELEKENVKLKKQNQKLKRNILLFIIFSAVMILIMIYDAIMQ
jgi:hypothetical protein